MKKWILALSGTAIVGICLLASPQAALAETTVAPAPAERPTLKAIKQHKWLRTLLRKSQSKAYYA